MDEQTKRTMLKVRVSDDFIIFRRGKRSLPVSMSSATSCPRCTRESALC